MIVTISGSMRNFEQMLVVADELTRQGAVVLMPFCRKGGAGAALNASPISDDDLDDLHIHKIDLSEMVVVVADELGYFGDSTRAEIEFATREGKRVRYARVIRRNYRDTILFEEAPTEKWCETCAGKGTRNGTLCTDCDYYIGSGRRKGHKPEPAVIY